ncbi:hypothetical protein AHMF7605_02495 [Adhaeribacter arboris]|uniref:Methyltransferase FkbM domain-containing protein n=1 Tax=Adhaeribacter arboris TaxID=2072846 RepID=A0A2T2YAB0_9BACT|nr:FkbM family methyltransferase [Adhaeribacter arboris]PSR52471.1 hypothetical protein AHMF7605_02495 [Adhaeribacter arboris]
MILPVIEELEAQLDFLLNEDISKAEKRAGEGFINLAAQKKIVLIGSGNVGSKVLHVLREQKFEVVAFTDNNQAKWGTKKDGLEIVAPEVIAAEFPDALYIVCIWSAGHFYKDSKAQFTALGCKNIIHCGLVFWQYPQQLLPHFHFDLPQNFLKHRNDIKSAFNLFFDRESKSQFLAHVRARLWLDFEGLPTPLPVAEQYFLQNVITTLEDEVLLDGGAYRGDTLHEFIKIYNSNFKSYIALEPDPTNLNYLNNYLASLEPDIAKKVSVLPYALGAKNETLRFDASGGTGAALSSTGSLEVACVALDIEFPNADISFIKLDIEGAEQEALKGAKTIIQNNKPVIAVCIYHMPDCLWYIALYLHSLLPDYKFFCRTYDSDGWEFVLYAVPVARIK